MQSGPGSQSRSFRRSQQQQQYSPYIYCCRCYCVRRGYYDRGFESLCVYYSRCYISHVSRGDYWAAVGVICSWVYVNHSIGNTLPQIFLHECERILYPLTPYGVYKRGRLPLAILLIALVVWIKGAFFRASGTRLEAGQREQQK